jgi:RNA polymerase sigma-70 factor, ECF subfamily
LNGCYSEGTMMEATSLNLQPAEHGETLESRGDSLVIDDRTIYDELIAPMETKMMRCIWRIVRNADLAEDSLQDALAVIWRKRFQIRRHPNPPALILKICLNAAHDSLRRLAYLRKQTDLSPLANIPDSSGHDANRNLEERELEARVQQAILRLPRKRALAMMMRLIHDEPFEAIAHALDCSEVTVRIHISKGRAQLRKWLSPLCQVLRQEDKDE